jgi:hypothetical protein
MVGLGDVLHVHGFVRLIIKIEDAFIFEILAAESLCTFRQRVQVAVKRNYHCQGEANTTHPLFLPPAPHPLPLDTL